MNGMRLGIDAVTPSGFRHSIFFGRGLHRLPVKLSPLRGSIISVILLQSNH